MALMALPTLADLEAARDRIRARVRHTPLLPLDVPGAGGARVLAKPENLQRTGSFKIRGASHFLARMRAEDRARGVVTHSSGNHAQGVAAAAHAWGVPALVVIPEGAPQVKVDRTLAWGAEVVRCANTSADRVGTAERHASERGRTLVPPFDHPWIVEGQASIGLEIHDDVEDAANVLVCVGGGGLLAGIAAALRTRGSKAQILGVEPALAADASESFATGRIAEWPAELVTRTVADGVRTQALGVLNHAIIHASVDGFVTVEEDEILDAAAWYVQDARLVVEPTGGLTLAAYRRLLAGDGPFRLRPGPTVLLVSGGNVDPARLSDLAVRPLPS
jgi:threo-3-hydroxy-L-aspartate ammonia-lyase